MYRTKEKALAHLQGHSRYQLKVDGATANIDILKFIGKEQMSKCYCYDIDFTSSEQDIDPATLLNKHATFSLHEPLHLHIKKVLRAHIDKPSAPPALRNIYGVITGFKRLSSSRDEAHYQVKLEPAFARLQQSRRNAIYQQLTIPQIVEKVLREHHDMQGHHFYFTLQQEYPRHEQIMQWKQTDLEFIEYLLAKIGIWYRFEMNQKLNLEVLRFGDGQRDYHFLEEPLPSYNPSGLNDEGEYAVWNITSSHRVVEKSTVTRDYNYRKAERVIESNANLSRLDSPDITYGESYHYGDNFLEEGEYYDPAAESGHFFARLHHERYLNRQHLITASSTSPELMPGQMLKLSGPIPAIAKPGIFITKTECSGSRHESYKVVFSGIPYDEFIGYRPAVPERPTISGTVPAVVRSTPGNESYGHLDNQGRYRVQFLFDRDEWQKGHESLLVRLAKPYAGDTYGFHWPLLDGTEVAIAFEHGDPNRPYIAHVLHNSKIPDHVTIRNYRRNVLRTPANNKIRMDDSKGEEHFKVSTEYGKSQLNLGHLVDSQRQQRGEGFELRTDDWGAIRAGKGLFITAEEQTKAGNSQREMQAVIEQLETALTIARTLSQAAEINQAQPSDTDSQIDLNRALNDLKLPGLLMYAPQGAALVSPEAVRIASGDSSVGLMANNNCDLSAEKQITATAGESISLYAHKEGMKLFAHQGKLEIQAQGDALEALAKQDINITSVEGKMQISAAQELILTCGGSFIKMSKGKIEIGCGANIILKANNVQKMDAAEIDMPPPPLPASFSEHFIVRDQESGVIQPHRQYRITTQEGDVFEGITDSEGKSAEIATQFPDGITLELP